MGRGTGDGAAPFLCVLGRAERTASHAVQPPLPVVHHIACRAHAPVFSLSDRRLLLIYNTRARDSATDCLLSVMEMARRRHFVPRGLSLGRQGGARCLLLVLPMLSFLKIRVFRSPWRASWRHLWLPWANLTIGFQKVCKSARIRAEWRWKCGQTSMKTVGLYIFLAAAEHLSMKKSIFAYCLQKCGHV